METIEIQILAQDVRNAGNFLDVNNCILATAIKRQLNTTDVGVAVGHSRIGYVTYYHDRYEYGMHNKDRMYSLNSPNDTLIRTILLNKQKNQ
jgi:hypothetical protein